MTALRDTIVAELVKREKACDDRVSDTSTAEDLSRLAGKSAAYAHAANIVRDEFEIAHVNDTHARPSLYSTPAAAIARIVAEHPRCIAMAPSLAWSPMSHPPDDRQRIQVCYVRKWVADLAPRIGEVTMDAGFGGDSIAADFGTFADSTPVVMVTIVCDGARYMVAIEAVR